MVYSISVDSAGRIDGICPDDLSGAPGWARIETDLTPRSELFDARGLSLYKIVGGAILARTQEEIDADAPAKEPRELTESERLDEIEAALIEVAALAAMAAGGE